MDAFFPFSSPALSTSSDLLADDDNEFRARLLGETGSKTLEKMHMYGMEGLW